MNYYIAEIKHEALQFGFHSGKRVISLSTGFKPECTNAIEMPVVSIHNKISPFYPTGIVIKPKIFHSSRCDPAYQGQWDKFVNLSEYAVHFHTNGEGEVSFMCDWLALHLVQGVKPRRENVKYASEIFVYANNESELDEFEQTIIEECNSCHVWLVPKSETGVNFCKKRVLELESPINYRLGINENILQS